MTYYFVMLNPHRPHEPHARCRGLKISCDLQLEGPKIRFCGQRDFATVKKRLSSSTLWESGKRGAPPPASSHVPPLKLDMSLKRLLNFEIIHRLECNAICITYSEILSSLYEYLTNIYLLSVFVALILLYVKTRYFHLNPKTFVNGLLELLLDYPSLLLTDSPSWFTKYERNLLFNTFICIFFCVQIIN